MASYNKIILVGNLTRDPVLRYTPSQMPVVDFGLAVNRKFKSGDGQDREEVLFVDCSAFGRSAEVINQYCQKGRPILVEGRLKLDTWEDKQGGGKRSKHTVVVENFQLLGGRDQGGGGGGGGGPDMDDAQAPPPPQQSRQRPQQGGGGGTKSPISPDQSHFQGDDIPF